MARLTQSLALASILILTALDAQAWAFAGLVRSVHDGDTITVENTRIRLYGIDAPELNQPGGRAARDHLAALVKGKTVEILPKDTDVYGRTVAVVLLPDGEDVNADMVRTGHAWVYRKYCDHCYGLILAQKLASLRGLGLWAEDSPEPPWRWRAKHGRSHNAR